jgi:hypothetical protein
MTGFVYVVHSSNGLFKIGHTNDPTRRLTMLKTSTADTLTLLGIVPATVDDERELHFLFRTHRVAREWFRWTPAMQPLIDALRPMPSKRRRNAASIVRATSPTAEKLIAAICADGRPYRRISLLSGLGPNFVHQLLTTGRSPSADNLARLARTLGIDAGALFGAAA